MTKAKEVTKKTPAKSKKRTHKHEVNAAIAAYQSPLPPAPVLREYEEVLPGSMERILHMTEKQQIHRHKWELKELDVQLKESFIGRCFAAGVLSCLVGGAFVFGLKGMEYLASCFLGTAALGVIPHFIKGSKKD